jgi:hypothetical protein
MVEWKNIFNAYQTDFDLGKTETVICLRSFITKDRIFFGLKLN